MIKRLLYLTSPQPIRRRVGTVYSRWHVCAKCSGYLCGRSTKRPLRSFQLRSIIRALLPLLAFHILFIPDCAEVVFICQCAATLIPYSIPAPRAAECDFCRWGIINCFFRWMMSTSLQNDGYLFQHVHFLNVLSCWFLPKAYDLRWGISTDLC